MKTISLGPWYISGTEEDDFSRPMVYFRSSQCLDGCFLVCCFGFVFNQDYPLRLIVPFELWFSMNVFSGFVLHLIYVICIYLPVLVSNTISISDDFRVV